MKNYLNLTEWETNLELNAWAVPQVKALILKAMEALQPQGTGCVNRPSFLQSTPYPILQFQARRQRGREYLYLLGLDPRLQQWIKTLDGQSIAWQNSIHQLRILGERHRAFHLRPAEEETYTYHLFNYTPFRSREWQFYQNMTSSEKRALFLSALLGRHIQTYYRYALNHAPEFTIEKLSILREKNLRTRGCSMRGFDLQFTTTAFLPEYLGLGPGAGRGRGTVRRPRRVPDCTPYYAPQHTKTTPQDERLLPHSGHPGNRRPGADQESLPAKSLPVSS